MISNLIKFPVGVNDKFISEGRKRNQMIVLENKTPENYRQWINQVESGA